MEELNIEISKHAQSRFKERAPLEGIILKENVITQMLDLLREDGRLVGQRMHADYTEEFWDAAGLRFVWKRFEKYCVLVTVCRTPWRSPGRNERRNGKRRTLTPSALRQARLARGRKQDKDMRRIERAMRRANGFFIRQKRHT